MAEAALAPVSVIVPAYRAAAVIGRALAGVAAQTVRPAEVVVVDDGSGDGTAEAAEACRPQLGPVALKVIRQDNRGAGAARNRALREASQPVVAFLDADDEWLPEKLARSLERLGADPNLILVAHDGWIVEDGRAILNECARRFRDGGPPFVSLYERGYIDTCTVVTRRAAVLAAGGFDESLPNAQDFDLWLALLRDPAARFLVFPEALSRYHVTAGSIMSNTWRRLRCCLVVARRYAPDLASHGGAPLRSLWFRMLAVHHEALTVLRRRGDALGIAHLLALLPFNLVRETAAFLLGLPAPPRHGLATEAAAP